MTSPNVRHLAIAIATVALLAVMPTRPAVAWDRISYSHCPALGVCASIEVATHWDGAKTTLVLRMSPGASPGSRTPTPRAR
jgi:hypothetical protein